MKLNWNFQRAGGGVQINKPFFFGGGGGGGVRIFSGRAHHSVDSRTGKCCSVASI